MKFLKRRFSLVLLIVTLLIVAIFVTVRGNYFQESLVDRYKDRLAYDVLMRHQEEGGDILEIYVEELKKKYKNIPDYVDEDGKKWVSLCQPEIDPYSDSCYVDSFMRPTTEADEDRFYEQWVNKEEGMIDEAQNEIYEQWIKKKKERLRKAE